MHIMKGTLKLINFKDLWFTTAWQLQELFQMCIDIWWMGANSYWGWGAVWCYCSCWCQQTLSLLCCRCSLNMFNSHIYEMAKECLLRCSIHIERNLGLHIKSNRDWCVHSNLCKWNLFNKLYIEMKHSSCITRKNKDAVWCAHYIKTEKWAFYIYKCIHS